MDNLRRSLVAPALLLFILAGWLVLPGDPGIWTVGWCTCLGCPCFDRVLDSVGAGA